MTIDTRKLTMKGQAEIARASALEAIERMNQAAFSADVVDYVDAERRINQAAGCFNQAIAAMRESRAIMEDCKQEQSQ